MLMQMGRVSIARLVCRDLRSLKADFWLHGRIGHKTPNDIGDLTLIRLSIVEKLESCERRL